MILPESEATSERWWGRHLHEVRWQLQLAQLLADPVFRGRDVPHGDGRAVVLVPGFLAGDYSLSVLSGWLSRIGYQPHGAGMLANVECMDTSLDKLERRVGAIRTQSGRRVALVGHSRGGHFVKALARRRPEWISHVVMLGAGLDEPMNVSVPVKAVALAASALRRRADPSLPEGCMVGGCGCRAFLDYAAAFPAEIPITSIYTRGDGCLRYSCCVAPYARCVEVGGGHVGLAFERRAYAAIAEALSATER
jgi:pimeloyl-ACP methyl ester carboxylesterase